MRLNSQSLQAVLQALGEQLQERGTEPVAFVVCGGSALQALGLVERTTQDVDVLAMVHFQSTADEPLLTTSEPLPTVLQEVAAIVERDFNLPKNWLNAGPADLLREGLPDGCVSRLHRFTYGKSLTVYFIDRVDQICLKTYAAMNSGGAGRHLNDLRLLKPTDEEMLFAAQWTVTQDALDVFPDLVRDFLRKTGFADVADRL